MASRNALVLIGGDVQELPLGDTLNGAGTATFISKGTQSINTGDINTFQKEYTYTIIGQTDIVSTSIVNAKLNIQTTADHDYSEMYYDSIVVNVGNIVVGIGFDIVIQQQVGKIYGTYLVDWSWI